jgi:hypothetical protein
MQVIIRNSRTGEEYEIASFDFRRGRHYRDPKSGDMQTYEEAGFKIVSLPNGEPYDGPLNEPPAERGKAD